MFRRRFEAACFLATAIILGVANICVVNKSITEHEQQRRASDAFAQYNGGHQGTSTSTGVIASVSERQRKMQGQGPGQSVLPKLQLEGKSLENHNHVDGTQLDLTPAAAAHRRKEKSGENVIRGVNSNGKEPVSGHNMYNTTMLSCFHDNNNNIGGPQPRSPRSKIGCRYDDIGDFLESNEPSTEIIHKGKGVIHEPLPCIPSHRRIPFDKANDWPYILEQRAKLPDDGSMTALMDYNAVIIPLYKNVRIKSKNEAGEDSDSYIVTSDLDTKLLDRITGRYHPHFSDSDADEVQYVSISRSSNLHACKPRFKFYFGTKPQDFLGISLLDKDLQRIEGTDVAVNVDRWLLGNGTAIFFDFQVVPVKSTEGKSERDQLILFTSGHIGTFAFPLDLRRVPPRKVVEEKYKDLEATSAMVWDSKVKGRPVPVASMYQYGDGMEVRFVDNPGGYDDLKPYNRPDRFFDARGVDRGKNFHIFEARNGDTYMETWPHGSTLDGNFKSHVTVPINFLADDYEPSAKLNFFPGAYSQKVKGKRYKIVFPNVKQSQGGDPRQSFPNDDPPHERPKMKYRGTSQIVDMKLRGVDVKVGISHSVAEENKDPARPLTDKRAYLSQFYAFSPDPPFEIVALSGFFCFNHMVGDDVGYSKQWISERPTENRTAPILLRGNEFRCPIITFASGMAEMIGHDGSNVIITYGVDDCYSRSIVVPKRKIVLLLLGATTTSTSRGNGNNGIEIENGNENEVAAAGFAKKTQISSVV